MFVREHVVLVGPRGTRLPVAVRNVQFFGDFSQILLHYVETGKYVMTKWFENLFPRMREHVHVCPETLTLDKTEVAAQNEI